MRAPEIRAVAEALLDMVEQGTTEMAAQIYTEPTSAYTDPMLWSREREHIFGGEIPLAIGLSGQLPGPGAAFPFDDYGLPILAWRDATGRFRAFVNVCRHRGARVLEEPGMHRRIACPYHGWTYDSDGTLVSITGSAGFHGLDTGCRSLEELPADEAGGILFVKPRIGAQPFSAEEHLCGLAPELDSWGIGEQMHFEDRVLLDRPMNWKTAMDTFGEVYHFAFAHRETLATRTMSNVMVTATYGPHQRFAAPTRAIHDVVRGSTEPVDDALSFVYLIHPNVAMLVSRSVQLYTTAPGREVGRATTRQRFFVPEVPTDDAGVAELRRTCDHYHHIVRDEDWRIGELIDRGRSSGANETVLFGRNEPCLHRMHDNWRAAVPAR